MNLHWTLQRCAPYWIRAREDAMRRGMSKADATEWAGAQFRSMPWLEFIAAFPLESP